MDIQVYTDKVIVEHEHTQCNVFLENVDLSLLVGQINSKELLEEIENSNGLDFILDYYINRKNEDE